MAVIMPFKGLRYNDGKIKDLALVTTPPYDIIAPDDQNRYYENHPNNIIRIELGKDCEDDNEANNKYTRAGSYLDDWIKKKILVFEDMPALYIYDQEFAVSEYEYASRRGIIAAVKLSEFSEGVVLPHEYTMPKAKTDRYNLMSATNANISQIFSLYSDNHRAASILDDYASSNPPDINYINSLDITERLWVVTDTNIINEAVCRFKDKQLFIADGHHRYETALNYRRSMASKNPGHSGDEPYNYVMMTLVDMDDSGLLIHPTHRVIRGFHDLNTERFLQFAERYFEISKIEFNKSFGPGYIPTQIKHSLEQSSAFGKSIGYFDGKGKWYYIFKLRDPSAVEKILPEKSPALRELDVTVLHSLILEPYFQIDAENLSMEKSLLYTRNIVEAMNRVQFGEYQCAFIMNPPMVSQVKEVSLAGEKMPQKSTYFYPKPTTGLVMYKF